MIIHVNSHIVYTKLLDDISLLNFKIFVAKGLISRYSNRRSFSTTRLDKQKFYETIHDQRNPNLHAWVPVEANKMSWFQEWKLKFKIFCVLSGMWPVYGLTNKRNCFLKHHLQFSITILFLIIYLSDYSCIDCSDSYCVFYVVEYAYIF